LPNEDQHCWVFGTFDKECTEKWVFEGIFSMRCLCYNGQKMMQLPGWYLEEAETFYALLPTVTHWMPYYTPEPPETK